MDAQQQKKLFKKVYIVSFIPPLITLIFYSRLPQQIPLGWAVINSASMGDKSGLWLLAICAPLAVLLTQLGILRRPEKRELRQTQMIYPALALLFVLLILSTVLMSVIEGLSPGRTTQSGFIALMLGLVMIFSGFLMPQIGWHKGPFIKSPWTFTDEEVWRYTHVQAGRMWLVAGIVISVLSFLIPQNKILGRISLVLIILAYVIPWIISRNYYHKIYRQRILAEESQKVEDSSPQD